MTLAHLRFSRPALTLAVMLLAVGRPGSAAAQAHPFLYSVVPSRDALAARVLVYADMAYGNNLFATLGPERFEQRAGIQMALGRRATLVAQLGWAATDASIVTRTSAQAEILASLTPTSSSTILALGIGGMRDYRRTGVALGRVVAGYRWSGTVLVANLRLERPFPTASSVASGDVRDALDVITTLGVTHELSQGIRLGFESVAEDLEGFVEPNEAEGGAKLMFGPSLGIGPRQARWGLTITGGPVLHLTRSSAPGSGSGAVRDISTTTGYVIRTSVGFRW